MTNTSKFWVGALVVGVLGAGAVVANRNRVEVTPAVPMAAAAEPAAPAVSKAALPLPKTRPAAPAVVPFMMSDELALIAKPLLQPGTDLITASEGFSSRESFLSTAYAAKNTGIPFVILKDRVVAQKQSLETAIGEVKPEVNAKAEAARAISAARSEIARPVGS
jgi:hypothetical protein